MKGLKNKMMNLYKKLLFFNYLGLFLCDILSIKFYFFGKIGVILWIFSWFLIFIYVVDSFIVILNKKIVFGIITLFSVIVLINTVNPVNLSGEVTQEIAGTLNHFKNSPDWGFRQTVLFGYPARQFFFPAAFSLFFERNQFFLNFGAALYYIFGLIIFSKGLLDYLKKHLEHQILISIILSFIAHVYWLNHFVFLYEQSFFPFIFSLMLCGLFLSYILKKSEKHLLLIGIVINYLIFSYTPSLSFVFFVLFVGLYLLFFQKKEINLYLVALIIFISTISIFSSLQFRKDLNLMGEQTTKDFLIKNLQAGFEHLFFVNQGKPFVSSAFQTIFLITIFYSVINFKKIESFFSGWWILMVIILSIVSKGYTYYGIDFRLQRAMIIFPVLFVIIAKELKYIRINLKKTTLLIILIFFVLTGYWFQINLLQKREPSRHLFFINWLREKIKEGKLSYSSKLIISDNFYYQYLSLNDSLQYFLPNFTYLFLNQYLDNYPLGFDSKNTFFILTTEEGEKYQSILFKNHNLEPFVFKEDKTLFLYEKIK